MKPFLHKITDVVNLSTGELVGCSKNEWGSVRHFKIDTDTNEIEVNKYGYFMEVFPKKKEIRKIRDSKAEAAFIQEINENTIFNNLTCISLLFEEIIIEARQFLPCMKDTWDWKLDWYEIKFARPEIQFIAKVYQLIESADDGLRLANDLDYDLDRFGLSKRPYHRIS